MTAVFTNAKSVPPRTAASSCISEWLVSRRCAVTFICPYCGTTPQQQRAIVAEKIEELCVLCLYKHTHSHTRVCKGEKKMGRKIKHRKRAGEFKLEPRLEQMQLRLRHALIDGLVFNTHAHTHTHISRSCLDMCSLAWASVG